MNYFISKTRRCFAILVGLGVFSLMVSCKIEASRIFTDPAVVELVNAASSGNLRRMDAAIQKGADVNAEGEGGFRPLIVAMLKLNKRGFIALLERGADPNLLVAKSPGISTSMIGLAAQADESFWLEKMIAYGGDINTATSWGGYTPLAIAILYNRFDNIRFLIEAGADIERRDQSTGPNQKGGTPLYMAAANGKWEQAYILLEAGADWQNAPTSRGSSIVQLLTRYSTRTSVDRSTRSWEYRTKVARWLKADGAEIPDYIVEAK